MSSLCPEEAQGAPLNLLDCIANVSSLLEHAVGLGKTAGERFLNPHYSCILPDPPVYSFSNNLLHALLAEHSSLLPRPDPILSFINQHRDRIVLALETTSLRCLSMHLLNMSTKDGFELGLYLLMDEPEYITDPGSVPSTRNIPETRNLLPLIQKNLLQRSYTIFTNKAANARTRRMAGKVLADMVCDCEEHCQLLGQLNGNDLRPIVDALADPDIVISFLASTTIRALHASGVSDGPDWEPNELLPTIINHVRTERDAIKQFHSYFLAERWDLPSTKGKARLDGALPLCYLVESYGAHAKGLPQGPVLLLFGADGLDLIHCSKYMSGWKNDYMAIRFAHRTRTRCIFSRENVGHKRLLSLHIHADDSIMMNDQRRDPQIIKFSVISEDDLTRILKGFEAIGIRCQTGTRTSLRNLRSSSLVMSLDADDKITPELFQPSEVPSQTVLGSDLYHTHWRNESGSMMEQLDYLAETATETTSQSSLTELTRTPTFRGTSSPRVRDSSHSHTSSHKPFAKGQRRESGPHVPNTATETAKGGELTSSCSRRTQAMEESISLNEENAADDGPARNTRSRCSQNEKMMLPNTALRPIPPNTQESLIFPKRRSRGKLYTAPTKTVVDWDEDLRATNGSVEQESYKYSEPTSISSPLSSGTGCAFNQSLTIRSASFARRKPVTKIKRLPRIGTRRKGGKRMNRQVKLSSPLDSVENQPCQAMLGIDVSGRKIERNMEMRKVESCNKWQPEAVDALTQACETADNISRQAPKASLPQKVDIFHDKATMKTSLNDNQHLSGYNQGRGQTVAEKLIAAFGRSSSREQRPEETHEKQSGDMEHEVEVAHESPGPHNVITHNNLHVNHEDCRDAMQDMPGSWAPNMNQEGSTGDEIYSVEIYSDNSADASRSSPFQGNEQGQNWVLGKEEVIFGAEDEQHIRRARWSSSLVTSSSLEPRSMASTFEFYLTEPPPKKHNHTLTDLSNGVASSSAANKMPCSAGETSEKIDNRDKNGTALTTNTLEERIEYGVDRIAECLESSSKTIVDKNGSPRLMQRAKKKHVPPKRRDTSPMAEQRMSAKRIKGLNQEWGKDATSRTSGENQAKDNDSRDGDTSPIGDCLDTNGEFEKHTRETFELMVEESSKGSGISRTTTTKEGRHSPFLNRLRVNAGGKRYSKAWTSASPALSRTREQHAISENEISPLRSQGYTAGKLQLKGGDSERKVTLELSKGAASQIDGQIDGQIDWQTSLQDLHKGMQKTLLSNSEHLSRQIESERATINRVLNTYRKQCHTILDQLFEAQMERISLCKQQMDSIKQQHADVCQGLIRRLEENERRLGVAGESQ
ncbi:hypothetical protein BJX76DRAFT_349325 [Aspergillus varians]